MRRTSLAALAASLVTTALVVGAPTSGAPVRDTAAASISGPLRYVAMGDSYSAASGVLPPDPAADPRCARSLLNYPHLVAEATGAALTDVTCGAADTTDYTTSQYDGVAPQLDALSKRTQLVTMTIGGNDSGVFINSIVACGVAGLSTLGQGSPCQDQYGSSFEDTIRDTTYPSLVTALTKVHRRAPNAEVAIIGYPWILPQEVGCFDKMPVAEGDVPYLRSLQRTLNNVVRRAAVATDSTYVNLNRVSEGHDACAPIGTRWVEPVAQGTNPVIVHPNALGEKRMAQRTMKVLGLTR